MSKIPPNILEIFGINGPGPITLGEAEENQHGNTIFLSLSNDSVLMTTEEAKYLIGRLSYLVDKVNARNG